MTTKATKKSTAKKSSARKKATRKKAAKKSVAAKKPEPTSEDAAWSDSWEAAATEPLGAGVAAESPETDNDSQEAAAAATSEHAAPATLAELVESYTTNLTAQGKRASTVWGYHQELKAAMKELGADTRLGDITLDAVAAFYACDRVTKTRSGKPKAMVGIKKTRRIIRLALVWAVDQGWLAEAPVPDLKPTKAASAK